MHKGLLGKVIEKNSEKMILKIIPLEHSNNNKQLVEKNEILEINTEKEIFEKVFFTGDSVIVIYG